MTIGKYFILIILFSLNTKCGKMDNQDFKVFGDKEILKKIKINCIYTIYKNGLTTNENKTLLYNGENIKIPYKESYSFFEFYVSYKNEYVGNLRMENIFRNASDQINHIYIDKNDNDEIRFWFVGREAEITSKDIYKEVLLPKEEFYKVNNIENEEDIKKYNQLFFNEY